MNDNEEKAIEASNWKKAINFCRDYLGVCLESYQSYEGYDEDTFKFTWTGDGWMLCIGTAMGRQESYNGWSWMYDAKPEAAPSWALRIHSAMRALSLSGERSIEHDNR